MGGAVEQRFNGPPNYSPNANMEMLTMAQIRLTQVEGFSQLHSYYYIRLHELIVCVSTQFLRAQAALRVFQTYDKGWIEGFLNRGGR